MNRVTGWLWSFLGIALGITIAKTLPMSPTPPTVQPPTKMQINLPCGPARQEAADYACTQVFSLPKGCNVCSVTHLFHTSRPLWIIVSPDGTEAALWLEGDPTYPGEPPDQGSWNVHIGMVTP
jgi:hypothetical protein